MKHFVYILAFALSGISVANAQNLEGYWSGVLKVSPTIDLSLSINLTKSENDVWSATLDSPDQGVMDIPVTSVKVDGLQLIIIQKDLNLSYNATYLKESDVLEGKFEQNGMSIPLVLKRSVFSRQLLTKWQRQRTSSSYLQNECFYNGVVGTLAGTVTKPKQKLKDKLPAFLLISGSGAQDRDETIAGHKPFEQLADCLTKAGYIVLRYDDRGTGKSSGKYFEATIQDLMQDAACGVEYLRSLPDVDASQVFLLGHSEGGLIASMLATQDDKIAGVVLLAAPILPLDELLIEQNNALGELAGLPQELLRKNESINRYVYSFVKKQPTLKNKEILEKQLSDYLRKEMFALGLVEPELSKQVSLMIQQVLSPGFHSLIKEHPERYLQKVQCPVWVLQGELDKQVLPHNASLVMRYCPQAKVKLFSGLNHLFQPARTGNVTEYAQIPTTIAQEVLLWLREQFLVEE